MGKCKEREYKVSVPGFVRDWSDKHRPPWCPFPSECHALYREGRDCASGWCSGIFEAADLDIVGFCVRANDGGIPSDVIQRFFAQPHEAMDIANALLFAVSFCFVHNPQYEIDSNRLHVKNIQRRRRHRLAEARCSHKE